MASADNKAFPLTEALECSRKHLPFAAALESLYFGVLYALWLESGPPGRIPRKADISPTLYPPHLLPNMVIVDVERDPLRFRYRLSGTRVDLIHNRNLTGLYVDGQSPPSFVQHLTEDFTELARSGRPQFIELEFRNEAGYRRHYRAIRLPLLGRSETIDHIVVLVDQDIPFE